MDTKQPEALQLADDLDAEAGRITQYTNSRGDLLRELAAAELCRQHAENETLRAGYDAARLEIESLKERIQELGGAARDVNSRRVQELEAQLAAVAAPKKWAPEEVADGGRGIRWVTNEGVHGRPTDHDVREYLKRTPTANGCHCDDCKRFYAAASDVTAAPAQAGEYPALVCDYCGALTPDPWHSSGMLRGKMSKHIHSCDVCAARGQKQRGKNEKRTTRYTAPCLNNGAVWGASRQRHPASCR